MNTRSVVRTTLRLLFFIAWVAVGLAALVVYFSAGGGDRCEQLSIASPGLRIEPSSPTTGTAPPGLDATQQPAGTTTEQAPQVTAAADEDVWGGAFGNSIGDSIGESHGLGMSGTGQGGAGTAVGTIGLGNIGTIGKGSGSTESHGYGSGKAAVRRKKVATKPPKISAEPTATADETDLDSDVDSKLANLPLGSIAFNTPETIPLGDSARIELLVSLKQAEEELRRAVRAAGPVDTARVKISDQMEARLTGLGFRIEAITPERQAVTRGEPTQWQWQIEPNKSATLELHLTLSALIEVDGVPATRAVRTFERTIAVDVPLVNRVRDFLAGHLELLMSFVLIPVAGGAYRYVRNKRKRSGPPSDQAPSSRQAA